MAKKARKARRVKKPITQKRYEQAQKYIAKAQELIRQLQNEGYRIDTGFKFWIRHYCDVIVNNIKFTINIRYNHHFIILIFDTLYFNFNII